MIKAIFWDNDGVLVDTERYYFLATKNILKDAGIPLTKAQYIEMNLMQSRGALQLAAEKGIAEAEIDRLRKVRNNLYSEYLHKKEIVISGVEKVLKSLRGKYTMGIVTSSRREHFEIIHNRTGFLRYFDFIIDHEQYKNSKPDPEPYLTALKKVRLSPDKCVVIEDSPRGLAAALGAGIRCIVIPTSLTKTCDFSGAYKIAKTVSEIPAIIKAIK